MNIYVYNRNIRKILLIYIFINGLNGNIKCNVESIKLKKKWGLNCM